MHATDFFPNSNLKNRFIAEEEPRLSEKKTFSRNFEVVFDSEQQFSNDIGKVCFVPEIGLLRAFSTKNTLKTGFRVFTLLMIFKKLKNSIQESCLINSPPETVKRSMAKKSDFFKISQHLPVVITEKTRLINELPVCQPNHWLLPLFSDQFTAEMVRFCQKIVLFPGF